MTDTTFICFICKNDRFKIGSEIVIILQQAGEGRLLYISGNTKDFVELTLNADGVGVSEQHPVNTTQWK